MARYVLLAFDDDQEAIRFAEAAQSEQGITWIPARDHTGDAELDTFLGLDAIVRGMWKKPTMFCDCTDKRKPPHGWTRGQKWGWWVCTKCSRPGAGWARGDVWYTALGKNILPISQDAPEYRGPGHKQHPGYPGPPAPPLETVSTPSSPSS
jgi:hypothetical protein